MLPHPSDLQYFITVAKTKNISRAAERLGISQPSLSVSIKRLEDNLGAPLLIRAKTGVQLTSTGQRFALQAQQLLLHWETIRDETLKDQSEVRGRYTIGCHPSVARYTLSHFLPALLSNNPALEIDIKHDISRIIAEEVVSFRVDLGLVINPIRHPDLVIKPLLKDEVKIWIHKNPSSIQRPGNPGSTLICDPNLTQSQEILKKLNKRKTRFDRIVHVTNLEVIASLVEAKAGAGILPARVSHQPNAKLKVLGDDLPTYKDQLALIYRADIPKTAGLKAVIESVIQSF